jgi:hypothetical protein
MEKGRMEWSSTIEPHAVRTRDPRLKSPIKFIPSRTLLYISIEESQRVLHPLRLSYLVAHGVCCRFFCGFWPVLQSPRRRASPPRARSRTRCLIRKPGGRGRCAPRGSGGMPSARSSSSQRSTMRARSSTE